MNFHSSDRAQFVSWLALSLSSALVETACQSKPSDTAAATVTRSALTEAETPAGQRARFFAPTGVVAYSDTSSNETTVRQDYLLVADAKNHAIRRVELSTGFVSTVAGTLGTPGSTALLLNSPAAVAVGGAAEVFVADTGNHLIRHFRSPSLVDHDGQPLHTVAGVPAQAGYATVGTGQFNSPAGLCIGELDSTGDNVATLFVADTGNAVIHRLTLNTNHEPLTVSAVELVAGMPGQPGFADATAGGLARFNHPTGLSYDRLTKKLYIADTGNHAVRVIDLAHGASTVSTLAGDAGEYGYRDALDAHDALFAQPVSVAINSARQTLQVADRASYTIREIDISPNAGTRQVSTLVGEAWSKGFIDGSPATPRFRAPSGVTSLDGVTYVADTGNNLIVKTTGAGAKVFSGQRAAGASDGFPESFSIGNPTAIACDGDRLYINGNGMQAIDLEPGANIGHAHVLTSEAWADFVQVGTTLFRPLDYTIEQLDVGSGKTDRFTDVGNDDLIGTVVACRNSLLDFQMSEPSGDSTVRFRFVDNRPLRAEVLPALGFGLSACGDNGRVYSVVANDVLASFDANSVLPVVTSLSVPGLGKSEVHALAVAGGFAYFTRNSILGRYHDIRKIELATGTISSLAGDALAVGSPFAEPGGLCVSGSNLFVADTGNGAIRRVDLTTGQTSTVAITRAE